MRTDGACETSPSFIARYPFSIFRKTFSRKPQKVFGCTPFLHAAGLTLEHRNGWPATFCPLITTVALEVQGNPVLCQRISRLPESVEVSESSKKPSLAVAPEEKRRKGPRGDTIRAWLARILLILRIRGTRILVMALRDRVSPRNGSEEKKGGSNGHGH